MRTRTHRWLAIAASGLAAAALAGCNEEAVSGDSGAGDPVLKASCEGYCIATDGCNDGDLDQCQANCVFYTGYAEDYESTACQDAWDAFIVCASQNTCDTIDDPSASGGCADEAVAYAAECPS